MAQTLRKLLLDFLSTLIFLAIYAISGSIVISTSIAIATGIAQFIYARVTRKTLDIMTWASLALVIVLGGATLLTSDPRFVLIKPSIAHFAIGVIMLKRNWMMRYAPAIVRDNVPHMVTIAGYAWAALMFALGLGTIAVAMTGNMTLWALYVTVVAVGAKILALALNYVIFRVGVTRKIRAERAAA